MSQQHHRKKKVEWSSNLSSSEPQPPENKSPLWDSESDHLLSYFMGSNGVASPPTGTQFTTTTSGSTGGGNVHAGLSSAGRPPIYSGAASSFRPHNPGSVNSSMAPSLMERRQDGISMHNEDDDLPPPPPTPAVQHYYPSSSALKSSATRTSATNSILKTSSFDSSSATGQQHQVLASNGMPTIKHGFLPFVAKPTQPYAKVGSVSMEEGSPISPAMMIGGDHEPLMLPPAPESQEAARARESHLEWLRQINAMAQANSMNNNGMPTTSQAPATPMPDTYGVFNTTPSIGGLVHPPQQQMSQQQEQQQQHQTPAIATFPAPGMPLHPTAAAALAAGNPLFFSHAAAFLRHQTSSPVETEEKRAKRLERNRESARKSRRRKKERLTGLGQKVNALHNKIEDERRKQINLMENVLGEFEKEQLLQLTELYNEQEGDGTRDERMGTALTDLLIGKMEPSVRKDIVEFQYTTLSQYLLPRYQKFLLWLTLQPESFFLSGKEEYSKREAELSLPRGTSGKISSKQVGDDLTNGRKLDDGRFIPAPPPPSYAQPEQDDGNDKYVTTPTAQAFDAARMWPLTCYELSVSVDQEDKFLQALKRVRGYQHFSKNNSQVAAATRMASTLKEAVRYQVYVSSFRKKKSFLEILTPKQALLYKEWLLTNRERCNQALDERRKVFTGSSAESVAPGAPGCDGNLTLEDLCRNLEEMLKISQVSEPTSST